MAEGSGGKKQLEMAGGSGGIRQLEVSGEMAVYDS